MKKGFTFIEVLIVAALIGILVVIVIPSKKHAVIRAKEAVLKENLFQIRDAINNFFLDKEKYPTSLEDLVTNRYLRGIPEDPFTRKKEWRPIYFEPLEEEEYDPEEAEGIVDVKSYFEGKATDGSQYSEW